MSSRAKKKGLLIIISGPSGSGKSTICRRLLEDGGFKWSISATTRKPRPGEVGDFIEHAEVSGNLYGTPKEKLLQEFDKGKVLIAEVDVQGGG